MAFINAEIGLDMWSGFDFSALQNFRSYNFSSSLFQLNYSNGASDTFSGFGFTYNYYHDYYSGLTFVSPAGGGVVTNYFAADSYGNERVSGSGLSIPFSVILGAASTYSLADDCAVVATALAGNDTVWGSLYADRLDGYGGNDSILGYDGNDAVYGSGGNDYLSGMNGNDYVNGGTGADVMFGGYGNDTFIVDSASDRVYDAAGQGTDTVYASTSFALAAGQYIESLGTTAPAGTAAINLYGNEFAQAIVGNNGANLLSGGGGNDFINGMAGNDRIYGGAGNDTLTGGAGNDSFIFNTAISSATNVDRITDFYAPADTIQLENGVMPGLGAHLGTLSSAAFWKSSTGLAHDGNDRIIYETDTGWLNYDGNGSAAGGAVHIAKLAPNLALTQADFLVI